MTEPTSSAARSRQAPTPLTPPEGAPLTLTAPAPPAAVVATQAPAMAPQVDPATIPQLDAKVDSFVSALMTAQTRSPEFAKQAANVRAHGRRGHPPRCRDLEPFAADSGTRAQGGRDRRRVQGRQHLARAAPHGRGPRPQPGDRSPQVPRSDPVRRQGR